MPALDLTPCPLVALRASFAVALDRYVQEVNLLVNAVDAMLAVDGVLTNAKVRAMLAERTARVRAALVGEP